MLKIFTDIFLFFKRERLYFLLLLFGGVFYIFVLFDPHVKVPSESPPSKELQSFQEAGKRFDQQMSQEENYQDFVSQKPFLAALFEGMTLFFMLAIFAGLILNIVWLANPSVRQWFSSGIAPPQDPVWPFSILFKTALLFVVWGILLSFFMGIVGIVFPKWGSENLYMVLHTFFLDVIVVFFMVRFLKQSGSGWRGLGFQVPGGKVMREVGAGFLGYLSVLPAFILVLSILILIANMMSYEPPPHPLVSVFIEEEKRQPSLVFFSVFLGMVVGPIVEEIFFRGFCYPILRSRIGKLGAAILSAAFFASIHHSGFAFWPIFVLGIGLAFLYEARRSLLSPIVMHITHNTIFILYFFLVKQVIS